MSDKKRDTGKPPLSLLFEFASLRHVAAAMEHGRRKYGRGTWAHGLNPESLYLDAALRHLHAHMLGERIDPESGAPHLAHAVASLLIAMDKAERGLSAPDLTHGRPPKPEPWLSCLRALAGAR